MKKLLSVILSLSLLLTVSTGFADKNKIQSVSNEITENITLPEIIEEDEAKENKYVGRLAAMEQDLSTFVFANEDGTQTLRMFSHPVKFVDEEGKTKDITLDIASAENGAFKTKDNSIITTFEKKLADGISLEYDDIDITMKPKLTSALSVASSNGKTVTYPYGRNTKIEYSLTYTGFKEDIVVEEYTGQTEYEFTLYTNGLKVEKIGEGYKVIDNKGNIKANIGDIIIFTADERNNTFGELTCETVKENEEYLLTIHIDADYLSDPKTVYPIRIDPTIEINYSGSGASAIEDVTINSTGGSDGSSGSLRVGKRETYGISRILMKFPTLSAYTNVPSEQVVKASVEIRDIICESDALEISCYQFTGNTWNESTANWSNVNPNSIGALLSSNTVSYANGVALTNRHRYSFDITSAVLSWKTNTTLFSKGIVFKASSAVENGSTYISKTFSSYERSSNQPSLSIIYTNPFYSTFAESEGFYDSGNSDLQYRSNCYGYALRMFYGGDAMPIYEPLYKQQPGEFADKTSGLTIESDITLTYWSARNLDLLGYEEYFGPDASRHSDANRLDYIYKLVKADMDTLGYTVIDATSAALTADITPNRRLCLLVTGWSTYGEENDTGPDYHFYMQHSDGTWSHKRGSLAAQNTCIDCGNILTNDNIHSHALEGVYSEGKMQYFYINKSAAIDYCHEDGHDVSFVASGSSYYPIWGTDVKTSVYAYSTLASGENSQVATIPDGYELFGSFEYPGDTDYYIVKAAVGGTITIQGSYSDSLAHPISIMIIDEEGNDLGLLPFSTSSFSQHVICEKGKCYYFKLTTSDEAKYPTGVTYSIRLG